MTLYILSTSKLSNTVGHCRASDSPNVIDTYDKDNAHIFLCSFLCMVLIASRGQILFLLLKYLYFSASDNVEASVLSKKDILAFGAFLSLPEFDKSKLSNLFFNVIFEPTTGL